MKIENLPADVITTVSEYLVGEPKYMRMKYNKALKNNTTQI